MNDGLAFPILLGHRDVIEQRLNQLGLHLKMGQEFELIDPRNSSFHEESWKAYHALKGRRGISPEAARTVVQNNSTVMASLLVLRGYADALLCGPVEHYKPLLEHLVQIFVISSGSDLLATLTALLVDQGCISFVMFILILTLRPKKWLKSP